MHKFEYGTTPQVPVETKANCTSVNQTRNSGAYEIQRQGSGSGTPYVVGVHVNGFSSDEENLHSSCSCPQSGTGAGTYEFGARAHEFRSGASEFGARTASKLRPVTPNLIDTPPIFRLARPNLIRVAPDVTQSVELSERRRIDLPDAEAAPASPAPGPPGSGQPAQTASGPVEATAATTAAATKGTGSSGQRAAETTTAERKGSSPPGQGTAETRPAAAKGTRPPAEGTEAGSERGCICSEFRAPSPRGGESSGIQCSAQQRHRRQDIDRRHDPQSRWITSRRPAGELVTHQHEGN